MIELENISKRFSRKEKKYIGKYFLRNLFQSKDEDQYTYVLKNIDLKVNQGERIGLIGKNKAGKTTLLQVIAGILEPTSGKMVVKGTIIPIFAQSHLLGPDPTGREYVYLHGSALGIPKKIITERLQQIIEFSEITTIDTPVKFYSTGMRARLAISVALHLPADILVLDEVFLGSDVFYKEKVINLLKERLKDPAITLIMVSHSEDVISPFCNRIILLENGAIVMDGNAADVLTQYNSILTR